MNILLLYPEIPETYWSFKNALKFIGKKASNPPLGLITIAAMLPSTWNKKLIDLNIQSIHENDWEWADFVMISAMIVQKKSTINLIKHCKSHHKKIIAGGPLFSGEPELFRNVDHLVLNEGEITLPEFLDDLKLGVAKHMYTTNKYADIQKTPAPLWELLDLTAYDSMSIQFSRGCPFNCDFCNVTSMLGHVPRIKSKEQIMNELDRLYVLGWTRNVFFVDDNFIGNKKILKNDLLPALIEWRKNKIGNLFITESSINLADDVELCDLMVEAGFTSVFVGIETPDTDCLVECHKSQNNGRDLLTSIHHLQEKGLQVMGGFIVGFDKDTPDIFHRQYNFIQESGIVTAMVGLLQALPGTKLYDRLQSENRILSESTGDNVDGTTNIRTKMNSQLLKTGYTDLLHSIYSPKGFFERISNFLKHYAPPKRKTKLQFAEIRAFFRAILKLGIFEIERKYFWKLFFSNVFQSIEKLATAVTFCIYGYHFRKVSENVLGSMFTEQGLKFNTNLDFIEDIVKTSQPDKRLPVKTY
jgi:radical SAM superfamily enzyme YgiQ (UPF0313 family)